ncbi:MAG: TonB-dependent receptor [candidate division WOR-3 bacterium]
MHDEQRFYERLLVMASLRFDYNSVTDPALNPKLALVYNPAGEHYLRATVGTAFRKPTLVETSVDFKINVEPGYEVLKILFEDIGISNRDLKNEILTNGEIGYQGFLLDRRLRLSTNIYFSNYRRSIELDSVIVTDNLGRIDLERTRLGYVNSDIEENSLGAGFGIEGEPLEWLTLFTRGEYFIEWYERDGDWSRNRDIFSAAAGVTLRLESGLGTQLALVYNGRYPNDFVRNPESVLSPTNVLDLPARTYLLASLSYRFDIGRGRLWAGVHFQNPFGARFREKAGIVLPDGSNYGGELSGPRVQGWLRWEY